MGASTPPISRPRNDPQIAAMALIPSAVPRWLAGKASVRIAVELANRNAPPIPCTIRQMISQSAALVTLIQVTARKMDAIEDREAKVVHAYPAEHVAQPPERDHQHGRYDQEAHEHPQQVTGVTRRQRVDVDPA